MRPPATDQLRAVLPGGHDLDVRHCATVADLTRQPFTMWTAGGEPLIMTLVREAGAPSCSPSPPTRSRRPSPSSNMRLKGYAATCERRLG
ncbi:hypothetical protein [Nonomuraea sp. KM88]|uniref:hypothetical protein n=1 Tax=Nonomuraea sp. KM88 TaxID=3457427 RepID=UPI003FCC9E90